MLTAGYSRPLMSEAVCHGFTFARLPPFGQTNNNYNCPVLKRINQCNASSAASCCWRANCAWTLPRQRSSQAITSVTDDRAKASIIIFMFFYRYASRKYIKSIHRLSFRLSAYFSSILELIWTIFRGAVPYGPQNGSFGPILKYPFCPVLPCRLCLRAESQVRFLPFPVFEGWILSSHNAHQLLVRAAVYYLFTIHTCLTRKFTITIEFSLNILILIVWNLKQFVFIIGLSFLRGVNFHPISEGCPRLPKWRSDVTRCSYVLNAAPRPSHLEFCF